METPIVGMGAPTASNVSRMAHMNWPLTRAMNPKLRRKLEAHLRRREVMVSG